jgi:hypothetical protein
MKYFHKKMKFIFNIAILLIISSLHSLADTYEERSFIIEAKFGILPSIKIMKIYTELEVYEDNYNYIFDIKTNNIVNSINEINGTGAVIGNILADGYIPSKYTYTYKRKEKNKFVEIIYKENGIQEITVKPKYDKSKLTPLTDKMLKETIDPPTFFLSILDYKNINNCHKIFRVFDGKRRYDVKFNKSNSSSHNQIVCEASQIKLGGYKNKENDVFAASDFIKVIYDKSNNNKFLRYEAKNGSINIIIVESKD